jgi:hypothetical protein
MFRLGGLLAADEALWQRIRRGVVETLPARLAELDRLGAGLAVPPVTAAAITRLRGFQRAADRRTLDYADAAALDREVTTWTADADALVDALEDLRRADALRREQAELRQRAAAARRSLQAGIAELGAAPDEVRGRVALVQARQDADGFARDALAATPAESAVGRFEGAVRAFRHDITRAVTGHIAAAHRAGIERLEATLRRLGEARAEPEVPGGGDTGRGGLTALQERVAGHLRSARPADVGALGTWQRTSDRLHGSSEEALARVAAAALREGRAVVAGRANAQVTDYQAHVAPWLTSLPDPAARGLDQLLRAYRDHAAAAPTALLADLVRRQTQLGLLDTRYNAARADPRLTALAALTPGDLAAARAAVGAPLVGRALTAMSPEELAASGNVVLRYLAAHGVALTPILPRYGPTFAYRASPADLNAVAAGELTVLGWFRGAQGTMAGKSVSLDKDAVGITRHGGQMFAVNFPHFVEVHLARYADAGELRGRTDDTTFYPDTVTTASFITNQLQAGLRAWPDMPALVAAINNGTAYNEIHQLTQGGFVFRLRVQVGGGRGSLVQCYPIAPGGGALLLTAARTRAMGRLLGLLI